MKTKKSLLVLLVGLFVAVGIAWIVQPVYADLNPDHLKCYKVREDVDKVKVPVELLGPEFGDENCEVILRAKFFCVPVEKNLIGDAQSQVNQGFLESEFLCYTIRCEKSERVKLPVSDQFGQHEVERRRPEMLCVPAFRGEI